MSSSRRHFLGALGAGALLPVVATMADATPGPESGPKVVSADWDMSWLDRVTGAHRAVFDGPELSEGLGVFRAALWPRQVREVYGTATTVTSILVLRHAAIDLAMGDSYWARFPVAKQAKWKNPSTKQWWTINPMRADSPETPSEWAGLSIEAFLAAGGIVLACNLAFQSVVDRYREKSSVATGVAREQALADLLPGVIMQPSGFFAAIRAQQAGCLFMPGA